MPPPTGRRQRSLDGRPCTSATASSVSFGSHSPYCSLAFSPAGTSNHDDLLLAAERLLDGGVEDADAGAPDVGAGAVTFDIRNDRIVGNDEPSASCE